MRQVIRNNVFETNSSSIHSIVIEKSHYDSLYEIDPLFDKGPDVYEYNNQVQDVFYNVPLIQYAHQIYDQPDEILSYLYSLAIMLHFNPLEDKLRKLFPNCVFQKPLYDINDEYEYCDDRTITNFCDCVNVDLPCFANNEDTLYQLTDFCLSIIYHGKVTISEDSFKEYLRKHELNKDLDSDEKLDKYFKNTYVEIIGEDN